MRVAITTDRFESAGGAFRRYGFEPVALPCVQVEPAAAEVLVEARRAAELCDVLLITSARTVELLWPNGSMPSSPVAAVGQRTAAAVASHGGNLGLTGQGGVADLIDRLGSSLDSAAIVFPHAGDSPSLHSAFEALRGRAANLVEFEVYRTTSLPPGPDAVAAVAFSSPSAVQGWRLSRSFDTMVIGVIGPTTRLAVAAYQPPDVVAAQPSHDSLARAMASHLEVPA